MKDGSGGGKVASARRALACVVWVYIVVTGMVVVVRLQEISIVDVSDWALLYRPGLGFEIIRVIWK